MTSLSLFIVMVVFPRLTPCTTPFFVTVAIFLSAELNSASLTLSGSDFASLRTSFTASFFFTTFSFALTVSPLFFASSFFPPQALQLTAVANNTPNKIP